MSKLSMSMLSASASEFVPLSFLPAGSKDLALNSTGELAASTPKPKKSKEMRGPRRRHKKTKGDNCSITTSISRSQYGDEEDDAISYLSLEGSCPGEYYDTANDGFDNLSYNNVSYPNLNYINDQVNPLARQRWMNSPTSYHSSPAKMTSLRRDYFGRIYEEYTASPAEFENEFLAGAHSAAEGDWSHWFDNVCEQFGRSSSPDNLSLPHLFKKQSMRKRTPSECSQDSWLDLQQEWVTSKQLVSESDDIVAEELERKKWGEWAMHASEKERQRRITAIEVMDVAQDEERRARGKWALEAIERERNDRISAHFLVSLASTNWFNETISAYSEDYELVCPYYRMGCKVSCRRSTLQRHLSEECIFARQIKDMDVANTHDNFKPDDYEIICPNAFMGCTYTCNRKNVHDHLLSCSFTGISKEQDLEERQLTKQAVIQKCEDERDRRQKHLSKGSGYWSDHSDLSETSRIRSHRSSKNKDDHNPTSEEPFNSLHQKKQKDVLKCHSPASSPVFSRARRAAGDRRPPNLASHCHLSNSQSLHHLLRSQVQSVVASLHDETAAAWACRVEEQRARRPVYEAILGNLRASVAKLWHFCRVESYGSYSTGLFDSSSDLDLVVCFSDECQTLLGLKGVVPLLHLLAEYLTKEAGHLIQITNIIIHARVPIIKAVSVDPHLHTPHTSAGFSPGQSDVYQPIHIDISIDSPLHSGLATTEMVCTLMQGLPPLGPVVSVLKDYLKLKGLADAFTGGLNSYGLFILMLLPLLKQLRDSRDLLGCEPIGGITGSGSGAVTPVGPTGAVSSAVTTEAVDAKAATVEDENASPSPNLSPEPLAPDSAHGGRLSPGQDAAVRANASSSSSSSGSGSSGTLVSKPTDAASAPDGFGHGDGMLVDTKSSIRGSRDTDSDRDSDRDRHTIDYIQTRDGGNASTGVDSKAANYCLDPINLAARLDECDSSDLANGSGSPLAGQAEVEVELEVEGKPIERTERGTSSKVTSVYMEAVARAALSKKNSNDSIKAHMSKGASERKLKSLKTSSEVGQMDNSYPGDRDESWSRRKSNAVCVSVIDTQNTDASLALPGDDQSPPAPCIPHAPPPSPMPNPDPSSAATANRASSFERNSNTPTRTSTPARPPLRPTPPVTLKEYLTTKHLLHSTYTVARSALKPSQSGTLPPLPPPAPSSPNSPQQSSSQSTPPLAAPSKSSTAYDSSIGIASHPTKSFQTSFSSSGAIATYQYLRPKSTTSFNRNQNISPIATPKQSLGQMQLSSSKKFPIRIIFSSPPSFSPYKHTSGPSSSSISKAGALYIMNVMNNHHGYTWTNLKQQREFGRKVAFKLLDSPDNGDFNRCNLRDPKKSNFGNSNRDMRVPCVLPLEAPILGSLLQDFLLAYGEELQCGRHGYSARDYGFRFDIDMDSGSDDGKGHGLKVGPVEGEDTPPPIHPHAGDPLLVEDPVNVMNNVTKNCYKAPAVQKAFFEALERFKGIAVRRKPLNSSLALSPVNSGRRFQFPAPALAAKSVIGPHLVSPLKDLPSRGLSGPHPTGQTLIAPASETTSQECSAHSVSNSAQGSACENVDQTPPALPPHQLPGSVVGVTSAPPATQESYTLLKEIFGDNR